MKKIGLVVNAQRDKEYKYANIVISALVSQGYEVLLQETIQTAHKVSCISGDAFFENCDALVTLGGDGTILQVAAVAAEREIPILGVNLGHLGYLTQLEKHETDKICRLLTAKLPYDERFMLKLTVANRNGEKSEHYALNDITVSRQIVANTVHATMYANDELVFRFRSDGLIFATPTGSTAYSMSAGGPIADSHLKDIIIVTPVCEHSFFSKSMIFSAEDILRCCIEENDENTYIIADGKIICSAEDVESVLIEKSPFALYLFGTDGNRFYRVLNSKFS